MSCRQDCSIPATTGGEIDGIFGWSTYWALRNFQESFGLPVDGLAGTKTKQTLQKASRYDEAHVKQQIRKGKAFTYYGGAESAAQAANAPKGFSQNDIQLMANAVYKDVLCYQFSAENGVASYRIFLNAETGKEEHIEKLAEAEQVRGA